MIPIAGREGQAAAAAGGGAESRGTLVTSDPTCNPLQLRSRRPRGPAKQQPQIRQTGGCTWTANAAPKWNNRRIVAAERHLMNIGAPNSNHLRSHDMSSSANRRLSPPEGNG